MSDEKAVALVSKGIIIYVSASIIIGVGGYVLVKVTNGITKVKFNRRIKKGLEDGSIVSIDGKYYEKNDIEEA